MVILGSSSSTLTAMSSYLKMVFTVAVLVAVICVDVCHGFPLNKTSYVNVHIPHSLYTPNGMPHRLATFGTFRSRATSSHGSMSMPLYYTDSDLCQWPINGQNNGDNHDGDDDNKGGDHDDDNKNGTNHTVWWSRTSATSNSPKVADSSSWNVPYILMANRGNCTFVTKSRHAQMSGAAGLVIADTHCLCSDHACVNQTNSTEDNPTCQTKQPVLADNGSGGDVTIPVVLLDKLYGNKIKTELVAKQTSVLLDMKWHPPQTSEYLMYTLWMDPLDDYTKDIIQNFAPIAHALGDKVKFMPRMMIHDGKLNNCPTTGECSNSCTNNGRYCYPSAKYVGSDIVKESLRRTCIWKHHGQDETTRLGGEIWWDYITYFNEHCSASSETFASDKCIQSAYKHSHVQSEDIEECMKDSGSVDDDIQNALLDAEITAKMEYGVYSTPYIWIQHKSFMDSRAAATATAISSVPTMLEDICNSFVQDQVPEVCVKCLSSTLTSSLTSTSLTNLVDCASKLKPSKKHKSSKKKKSHRGFWTFVLLVFVMSVGGFLYYKKRQSEDPDFGVQQYSLVGGDAF